MGKWVLCKDHLPEEDSGEKWVTVKGHDVILVEPGETITEAIARVSNMRCVTQAIYSYDDGCWIDPGFGAPLMVQPIAWMNIDVPDPYDGEVYDA